MRRRHRLVLDLLPRRKKSRVILVASGNVLQLLTSTSKGYRDIQTTWSSPSQSDTTLYRFDATQYQLHKRKSTRLHP